MITQEIANVLAEVRAAEEDRPDRDTFATVGGQMVNLRTCSLGAGGVRMLAEYEAAHGPVTSKEEGAPDGL